LDKSKHESSRTKKKDLPLTSKPPQDLEEQKSEEDSAVPFYLDDLVAKLSNIEEMEKDSPNKKESNNSEETPKAINSSARLSDISLSNSSTVAVEMK